MKRREFIQNTVTAGAILPIASSGMFAKALPYYGLEKAVASDRILVLINLFGGNDGLNTVVPFNDPVYISSRKNIGLKKSEVLPISNDLALHNSLSPFYKMYNDGNLAVVSNVGYPNHNRSHFRSTDIFNSASDEDKYETTGWIGRYLENKYPNFPNVLPDTPYAIQVASATSLLLQSNKGSMGMALDNPDRLYNLAKGLKASTDPVPTTLAGPELSYVRDVISQSNKYSSEINKAMLSGTNSETYGADSLASQLRVVARLINGGLNTNIFVVSLSGFDTHTVQLPAQAQLLSYLSNAVNAFMKDLSTNGNADRVVCMTYSEFGRRLNENGSQGTDHGAASPQFVIGKNVLGGKVIGGAPNLTNLDDRGDVKHTIDFRQIYSSVLEDWLGVSSANSKKLLLNGSFSKLPLFKAASFHDDTVPSGMTLSNCFPNPVIDKTKINFNLVQNGYVAINLFSPDGKKSYGILSKTLQSGEHTVEVDATYLPAGNYMYILEQNGYKITNKMSVVR
jgi:uncharacterized protein (DUF1501 family)